VSQISGESMSRGGILTAVALTSLICALAGSWVCAEEFNAAMNSIAIPDLRAHLEVLSDDAMEGREAGSRGGRAAAAYLSQKLAELGLQPNGDADAYTQTFERGAYRNLLAVWEGCDADLKHQYVLVGAHYDHVGYGTRRNSRGPWGRIHNGADDNASGVSGVLEVAEALTLLDPPPKRSVLFALWDGEEKGMLGSKHWCANPTVPLRDVAMAFNADMIGRLRGNTVHVFGARTACGLRRWTSESNPSAELLIDFSWEMKANSDQFPFVQREIPTLMIHTGLHDEWHRPSDDADTINYEGASVATRLLFSLVVQAANQSSRLEFRKESRSESPADRERLEQPAVPRAPRLGIAWKTQDGQRSGVTLSHVTRGSAADRAGLQVGDRLLRLGEQEVADESRLGAAIWAASSPATIVVERAPGEILQLSVQLDGEPLRFGFSWREDMAEPGTVVLVEIVPHSAAFLAGLQVSDRIYRVADRDFCNGDELGQLLASLPSPVPLLVERSGRLQTVVVDAPSVP